MPPQFRLTLAAVEMSQNSMDPARVVDAFEQSLKLDPNNVAARIQYAEALEKLNRHADAVKQYQRALDLNAKLESENPKRLRPEKAGEIEKQIKP